MSLYIGKDTVGNALVHVTNSPYDKSTLQVGDRLPTTVFNTSIGYPSFNIFDAYSISVWRNINAKVQTQHYCAYFNQEAIDFLLTGGEKQFFVLVDNELYNVMGGSVFTQVFSPSNIMWAPNDTDAWGSVSARSDYNVLRLHYANPNNKVLPSTVRICISDIKVTGEYTKFFNGGSILLSKNGLTVGGKNLFDYKYIVNSPINNVDITYSSNGSTRQIINSVPIVPNALTITTNDGVELYNGTKKIMDSKVLIQAYIVNSVSTFTKGILTHGTHHIWTASNSNCILLISMKLGSNGYVSKYFDMSRDNYEELFAFTLHSIFDPGSPDGSENYYYWKKVDNSIYLKYVQTRNTPWNVPAGEYTVTTLAV